MSLAIGSVSVAPLAVCTCGMCAACTARPLMRATPAPVEPANDAVRTDSFTLSGLAPTDDPANDPASSEAQAADDDSRPTATTTGGPRKASGEQDADGRDASGKLTADEQRVVQELQARDREVRAHEAAHQAAGGGNVGGASYSYQQGPDGRQYAIGGEVPVDLSTSGSSPEAVIAKMAQVQAAATAPADPSPQDFAVAAAAAAIAAAARQQEAAAKVAEQKSSEAERMPEPVSATTRQSGGTTAGGADAATVGGSPERVTASVGAHERPGPTSAVAATDEPAATRRSARAISAYQAAGASTAAAAHAFIDQHA
jgi:hypothetical protein